MYKYKDQQLNLFFYNFVKIILIRKNSNLQKFVSLKQFYYNLKYWLNNSILILSLNYLLNYNKTVLMKQIFVNLNFYESK